VSPTGSYMTAGHCKHSAYSALMSCHLTCRVCRWDWLQSC
jgi:hypothetical protein